MNKLYRFFASPSLAIILLITFAVAMATATFVENDFGTATAWQQIYDTTWFELVMAGLGLCFITNIYKYRLWRKEKWPILLFHLAFIIILLGAGVTRYTATSGIIRIREGASSSTIISDKNYLHAHIRKGSAEKTVQKELNFSPISDNSFSINTDLDNIPIRISYQQFVADAIPQIVDVEQGGEPILEMVVSTGNGRETLFLKKGEIEEIGAHRHQVGFEAKKDNIINISEKDGEFSIISPEQLDLFMMATQTAGNIKKDSLQQMQLRTLYRSHDFSFVPLSYHPKGVIQLVSTAEESKKNDPVKDDALVVNVAVGEEKKSIKLLYRQGFLPTTHEVHIGETNISLSYGAQPLVLPFALQLNDFQLERYPGSTSPSSYASEVTVLDQDQKIPFRIFMNNVLDYKGYRFFQASYDTDELGTVLSANKDQPGTYLTYLGYLLMGIGMFFTLFGKSSRFWLVNKKLKELKSKKITIATALLIFWLLPTTTLANETIPVPNLIEKEQASLFGNLLVQDLDGRIKPINTLASEFLRKVSRSTNFKYQVNNKEIVMDANQVFMAMHISPHVWQQLPLIKINQEKGGQLLKNLAPNKKGLVSFNVFLDQDQQYILAEAVEIANQKKPSERNEFDKEILKIDERFNILYNVFSGNYLKIFPNVKDKNNTWFSYTHHFEDFTEEDAAFAKSILPAYFKDILEHKWSEASEKISYIATYQNVLGKEIIPSEKQINAEIWYNKMNLNFWLFQVFFTVGMVLLVLAMVKIFISKNKIIAVFWNGSILLVLISFLLFTGNILLRWYVSEHAPWSNGYEMLVFVAWVLILCGLITFRKSDFSLPLATLFSGALLFVSYLDWLNPEITNLMPVLKSYWLKVHVATIVSSYAPLALSAILGCMALLLLIFRTQKTKEAINIRIKELTYINEISMTIGLFLLAIGTFLGGVWANESWGRYWAWDPKETWALISIIVYTIVLHLRFIPGLKSQFVLNTASMFAFWSIIMTSFGVNYYLSGLHSYASGDPLPIPTFIYVLAGSMIVLALLSYVKIKSFKRTKKTNSILRPSTI